MVCADKSSLSKVKIGQLGVSCALKYQEFTINVTQPTIWSNMNSIKTPFIFHLLEEAQLVFIIGL